MFRKPTLAFSWLLLMLKNSRTAFLVYFLAFNIALPARLYADELDDYEAAVEKAVSDMWTRVQGLVSLERGGMVPARTTRALNAYKATIRLDVEKMEIEAKASVDKLQSISENLEKLSKDAAAFPKQTLSLENYDRLLQIQQNYSQYVSQIPVDVDVRLDEMKNSMLIHQTSLATVCQTEIPKVKRDQFGLPPLASYVGKAKYTYINPVDFQRDPVAQSYAIAAASGYVVGSILVSIFTIGLAKTFAGVALTYQGGDVLLSVTTQVGTASGAYPPLFWVMVIAIVVYFITGLIKGEDGDKKRKERAEKAQNKLQTAIHDATEWFEQHRVSDEEYRTIANDICQKESNPDGSGILSGMKAELQGNMDKVGDQKVKVLELIKKIKDLGPPLNGLVTSYKEAIALQFKKDILADHDAAMKDGAASNGSWSYYNDNIKPMWNAFISTSLNDPSDEMEKCFYLNDRRDALLNSLDFHRTILGGSFVEGANSQKALADIDKLIGTLKKQVNNYIKIECGDFLANGVVSTSLTF